MTSFNNLYARPVLWTVLRNGESFAAIHKHEGYMVVMKGKVLSERFETLEDALRAIDRRI